MDITFSEQDQMLHDRAREFFQREAPLELVRAMEEDQRGYPPDLWRKMAGVGWLGVAIPEAYGGGGLGMLQAAIVAEQMGRVLAPAPYISTQLVALAVRDHGREAQKKALLPRIARGEIVATLAHIEMNRPNIGWERAEFWVTAKTTGDGYLVDGAKQFVPYAHVADTMLVVCKDMFTTHPICLLVDAKAPGIEVQHLATTGSDHQCHVMFRGTPVPESARIGGTDQGWPILERALERGTVLRCAYLAGAAQRALEFTTEYAKTRVQFGRPIATFQAVRHRCADMAVEADGARFITYEAAWALDHLPNPQLEVSAAKAAVSDAVREVMSHGHQVHGAIGFSEEHPMPLYSRQAKMGEALFGSASYHRERVAQRLGL